MKKTVYDKIILKFDGIESKILSATGLIIKSLYQDVDKKVPKTTCCLKENEYDSNVTDIGNKVNSNTNLVTNAMLNVKVTEILNRICSTVDLVKKIDYDTIIR